MTIGEIEKLASEGNKEAIDGLKKYYEESIKEYTKTKYGKEASEKIVELLPSLIDYYFENKIKEKLYIFLNQKVNALYKKKSQRKIMGEKIDITDSETIELTVNHYFDFFYKKIIKYNVALSKEEIKYFCYFFVKTTLYNLIESNADIRCLMLNYVLREIKSYDKDKEKLLKRYILIIGVNANVLNYFLDKYKYLFEKFKDNRMYNCLVTNYNDIVKESLMMITKVNCSIESLIIKNLHKKYELDRKIIENAIDNKNVSDKERKLIYDTCSYIKKKIYDKFKDRTYLDNNWLKDEIDKKYDDYVKVYLNGKMKKNIRSYLNTRLIQYFSAYSGDKHKECFYKTDEYYGYFDYICKYLGKLHACYPSSLAQEELMQIYDIQFKIKYLKKRKTDIRDMVQRALKQRIKFLNDSYQEQNIKDMALKYKQTIPNDVLEKEILNNVIDNLVSYYVSMGTNNKETFESLLINTLLNFDKTVYEDLDRLKKQEQCKVLNRHKN